MSTYSGQDVEDQLCHLLRKHGCVIHRQGTLNHDYKIDFLVIGFKTGRFPVPIGVQFTLRVDDYTKRARFIKTIQEDPFAERNVYLEMDSSVNLVKGALLAWAALVGFAADKQYADISLIGIRVSSNFSYSLFRLEAPQVENPPQPPTTPTSAPPAAIPPLMRAACRQS